MTRRCLRLAGGAALAAALLSGPAHPPAAGATEPTAADAARFSIARDRLPPPPLSLRDGPRLLLPAIEADRPVAPPPWLADPAPAAAPAAPQAGEWLDWELGYRRSLLDDGASTRAMRSDPSTGFSRQLDRDVLDLGLTWRLARTRLGLGYHLQSARPQSDAGDPGLSRFLPGSDQATHAFTLGVTREFGAGAE